MKISDSTKTVLKHAGTSAVSGLAGAILGATHPGWLKLIQAILSAVGGGN